MADEQRMAGIEQAMLAKLEHQTLPKTMDIKRRVDAGQKLSDSDMAFLDTVLKGLDRDKSAVERDPKWESLYTRLIDLYHDITRKALENEAQD
jgi:hypothetical protein